jgi:hypothetical protein
VALNNDEIDPIYSETNMLGDEINITNNKNDINDMTINKYVDNDKYFY